MLKIAICDDEQPMREYLKRLTEKCADAQISVFADGEKVFLSKQKYSDFVTAYVNDAILLIQYMVIQLFCIIQTG